MGHIEQKNIRRGTSVISLILCTDPCQDTEFSSLTRVPRGHRKFTTSGCISAPLSARKSEMSEPIQPEFNPGFLPPGRVVLGTGLEPAHLTATASKTVVSAIPPPERKRSRKIEARRSKLRRAGASAEIVAIAPQWSAGTWAPSVLPCAARIPPPAPGSPPQAMRRCPAGRPSSHTFPGERHFARGCPHRTGSARAETP